MHPVSCLRILVLACAVAMIRNAASALEGGSIGCAALPPFQ
jgi:hypothetical protein